MSKISADELAKTIESTLRDYADVTEEACTKGVREVANRCVSDLHSAHPSGSGKYGSWDEYNSSWVKTRTIHKKTYIPRRFTIRNTISLHICLRTDTP